MPDQEKILAALLANHVSGTPAPAQAIRDLIVSVFGGVASISLIDGSTPQTLGTAAAQLTGFAVDGAVEIGANADHSADQITIGCAGGYLVGFSGTFSGDAATYTFRLRKGGLVEGSLACGVTLVGGSDQKSTFCCLPLQLSAADVLTMWGEADSNGKNLTPKHMQFWVKRVS